MMLAEQEIVNVALETLREKLALSPNMVFLKDNNMLQKNDAIVQIMDVDFLCVVKNTVTTATIGNITGRLKTISVTEGRPILLIAKYITPTVVTELAAVGISTLDCSGNCNIRYEKNGEIRFHWTNKGEKSVLLTDRKYPAFQEAGLKVIFYLLQAPSHASQPYRVIQQETGVSLGAIKNVLDVLVERDFMLVVGRKRVLKNKKALLNLWVENYNQILKPKLQLGKMRFRTDEHRIKWFAMELPVGMFWGGESAAYMLNAYLTPGFFDIYTDIPAAHLLKTGFVQQDENGEIRIYQKFWKWDTMNHIVPYVLIYADLMGSGNSRCMEMAERLLEHELQDYK